MDLPSTVSAPSRTLASLTALLLAGTVLVSCTSTDGPRTPATSPGVGEPLSSAGVDALRAEVVDYLGSQDIFDDVRVVLVATGDEVVLAEYQDTSPEEFADTRSITKSVMSTLVGIAVDRGLIDGVDATLGKLLPDETMPRAVAGTTLEQVLTMTGGFVGSWSAPDEEFRASRDWVRAVLRDADPAAAGEFAYSDGGAHLLSAVLTEATGMPVLRFARSALLDPLGVDTRPAALPLAVARNAPAYVAADFAWPVDPQDRPLGWAGLKLRPEDLLALGRLVLQQGRWDGEQLVSAAWVAEATRTHVEAYGAAEGYGYLWWVDEVDGSPSARAWGYGGQMVEVVPARDLVVVVASDVDPGPGLSRLAPDLFDYLVDEIVAPRFPAA
ncbi:serine hydrolase [Nocardioides sp. HDW12B]|uniref:serine hydrolase domain-containing protein n=1 Tax=Nocardioides sp. HDW12B TaxID=2714939 RepID=UPI001F0D1BBB|nr:serine hydrolase [Nocardioides sp. HDW12B]